MNTSVNTISLTLNEAALRKSLRFAFARRDTCIQELLQNARRAGATKIDLTFDSALRSLCIRDNGCGIADFKALMTVGDSGWSSGTASAERPYGLGFLSAIYAAESVSIDSLGQSLWFSTEEALDYGAFELESGKLLGEWATSITLNGFDWPNAEGSVKVICRGFPVPVDFNGREIDRPCAQDDAYVATEVGQVHAPVGSYSGAIRVFLQGFQVWQSVEHFHRVREVTVHLDSQKYSGKFPDRDKVINQEEMIAEVTRVVKGLYKARLDLMKASLPPFEFCREAYRIAESLDELSIFNDIDVLPAAWLSKMAVMPHAFWDRTDLFEDLEDQGSFTREDFQNQKVTFEALGYFSTFGEDSNAPAHVFSYAVGALSLNLRLHDGHWVHSIAKIEDDSEIELEVIQPGRSERLPFGRLSCIGDIDVQFCDGVQLKLGERVVHIQEAFACPERSIVYVPLNNGRPAYVGAEVLKQLDDYQDDHIELRDDCAADESSINQFLMEMAAGSPKERVELLLQSAVRGLSLASMRVQIHIDEGGLLKVEELHELTPKLQATP